MSIGATSNISTGRGGAGNIGSPKLKPTDAAGPSLVTPHLKTSIYTTGRGGQGNMAKFEAAEARKAQDVAPVVRAEQKAGTTTLTGRGGAGNAHRVREDGQDPGLVKVNSREGRTKERAGSFVGRAKESLEKMRRSGSSRRQGSASSGSSVGSK